MSLTVIGMNYHSAPLPVREKFAISEQHLPEVLLALAVENNLKEVVLLSTCNRTEIYSTSLSNPEELMTWLSNYKSAKLSDLRDSTYILQDSQAIAHIMRVASGLESKILGETQIFGQLKRAYGVAKRAGLIGKRLDRLFQATFTTAKQIRSQSGIGECPVSVAYATVRILQNFRPNLAAQRVLLVGTGDMAQLVVKYLAQQNVGKLLITSRAAERAARIIEHHPTASFLPWEEYRRQLPEVDIIITATVADEIVLSAAMVEQMLGGQQRSVLVADLGVPRNVDPQVKDWANLYTIDDIGDLIEENRELRIRASREASSLIDARSQQYWQWLNSIESLSTLCAYRNKVTELSREVLERGEQKLKCGHDPQQVLADTVQLLTKRLIHHPTIQIRQAGLEERYELLDLVKKLFNLEEIV